MGKYVDNRTSNANKKKALADYNKEKAFGASKGSIGLKTSYTDKEKQRSQAQARTDASIQARMVAEREARLNNLNTE